MSTLTLDRPLPAHPDHTSRTAHQARTEHSVRTGRPDHGTATRRLLAPVGVLLALALLVAFVAAGASRMIEVTGVHHGSAVATRHAPAGYAASLWPLGFTVHWSDGTDETHLWW